MEIDPHRGVPPVRAGKTRSDIPLSLYVHIPWCLRKCPYCDFNSYPLSADSFPENRYIAALLADLDASLRFIENRAVVSVFFGGGTPSLLSGDGLARLLEAIRHRLTLSADAEITLEANPGAIDAKRFSAFKDAGVNRLSLGIQSFSDDSLNAIGRIHGQREAYDAIDAASRYFPAINIDLMYGLPNQTLDQAAFDLEQAIRFSPAHLSCYQLSLNADAPLAQTADLPDADHCADIEDIVEEKLSSADYRRYEISAFARPGKECKHNLNYWTFGDYLGIGAGAHSKLTLAARGAGDIRRQIRWPHPERYIEQALSGRAAQKDFPVSARELPLEFMMNALRLSGGIDAALFEARTFLPLARIEQTLAEAEKRGLLALGNARLCPTREGLRFLNPLLALFA